ncbi:MAG TPA: Tad domain-containing protein [Chloroflexia bacterium]|nr:Tad domain-containing protein [Chloroflexia bacterium]
MAAVKKDNRLESATTLGKKVLRTRTRGQALIIVGIVLTVLILFVGLGVDVGNMMARRAKLQSAVDAAVLSAAQTLQGSSSVTQTATTKAFQVLQGNGVYTSTLNMARTSVDFPGLRQVRMQAVQRVNTFFMRIIPIWQTVEISADATADLNTYAEINTKPFGNPGVVTELNLQVWGRESSRRGGDAYSARYIGNGDATTLNPWYDDTPYGYLYRIDVPASYIAANSRVDVEIWDADSYNRLDLPPAWPTPVTCSVIPCNTTTPTPVPNNFARCADPNRPAPTPSTTCDVTTASTADPGLYLGSFTRSGQSSRPAFWRVDEYRYPYTQAIGGSDVDDATTTEYTLWHFDPHITSAFGNPADLSDYRPGGVGTFLARYRNRADSRSDLKWYRPDSGAVGEGSPGDPGLMIAGKINSFSIQLTGCGGGDCYAREANDSMYFYLYVQGTAGSSENNYDLRVGPPQANSCGDPTSRHCYINNQYYDILYLNNGQTDWSDGGAKILAKRSLPLNLLTGDSFPLAMTQLSKNAAGQTLGVRHFDQDCDDTTNPTVLCTRTMNYQMQICGCTNLQDPNCWSNIATGYMGPNDGWAHSRNPDPEEVQIPIEGSANYNLFFGSSGQCSTSWLRIERNPSYSNDTTVWEMPFTRPRIIQ